MKYPCGMILDLLPLYCDGVCGEESKAAVEEHLAECGNCQEEYHRLRKGERVVPFPKAELQKAEAIKRVKKKLNRKQAAIAAAAALTVAIILIAGWVLSAALFVTVPYSEGSVTVEAGKKEFLVTVQTDEQMDGRLSPMSLSSRFYVLEEDGKEVPALFLCCSAQLFDVLFRQKSPYEKWDRENDAVFTVDMNDWPEMSSAREIQRVYYYDGPAVKLHGAYYNQTPQEMLACSVLVWEKPGLGNIRK